MDLIILIFLAFIFLVLMCIPTTLNLIEKYLFTYESNHYRVCKRCGRAYEYRYDCMWHLEAHTHKKIDCICEKII